MKKILLAVMVIFIAAFVVTCDEAPPVAETEVEYTDVVYSKDGSQVTIYLDGETVPVTKAERAMTLGLAMMSYDYLEVVFRTAAGFSRSAWELGQPAGISGAGLRGVTNYNGFGTPGACLFAGKKDGKTLFGLGKMTSTTARDGTVNTFGEAPTINALPILANTVSVTFSLVAIQTGLLIGDESVKATNPTYATRQIPVDSFTFTGTWTRDGHSSRQTLSDNVEYPTYQLPTTGTTTNATYTFKFMTGLVDDAQHPLTDVTTTGNYLTAILHAVPTGTVKPAVLKRTPRFMDGGRYMQPNGHIDTKTTVGFGTTYTGATALPVVGGGPFVNEVPLIFTTFAGNTGIFSFYLEIPVVNLDPRPIATTPAAQNLNGGDGPTTWYVRTGLGSDLYSLDDGVSSGGCVFMSTGVSNSDWLTIDWKWVE